MQAEAFAPIQLPAGSFNLDPLLDDLIRESSRARGRVDDLAHPVFGFVAALGGSGLRVAEILALCGCAIESGPLLASCHLRLPRALKVGHAYQIRAEVSGRQRKRSRRFGQADHIDLTFDLASEGDDCGTLRLCMIVPA